MFFYLGLRPVAIILTQGRLFDINIQDEGSIRCSKQKTYVQI